MRWLKYIKPILLVIPVSCINFAFEAIQLLEDDIGGFSAISFGNKSEPIAKVPCRAAPGTAQWPTETEWEQLNTSLAGRLLHPSPLAAVCYDGPYKNVEKCNFLLRNASTSRIYIDDPLTVLTNWPQGDTCHATAAPQESSCSQGGFPAYVVNVTTVKQIQVAVNFARNLNLRLNIKLEFKQFPEANVGVLTLNQKFRPRLAWPINWIWLPQHLDSLAQRF